jgi:hypothetical protein|tara:strand:+ start:175 stop:999 length:825 start_codon:yes stop_codon:yes gene_type:complete
MFNCQIAAKKYSWFVSKYTIDVAIETGTCEGDGTLSLSKHHDLVITCEIDKNYFKKSLVNFKTNGFNIIDGFRLPKSNLAVYELQNKNKKIYLIMGSSPIVLDDILDNGLGFEIKKSIVFYLDAHWGDSFPILDELELISKYNLSDSKIIIHDFYVPGFTKWNINEYGIDVHCWGYDFYKDDNLNFEYVKEKLFKINPGILSYFPDDVYSTRYNGGRGILYSVPPEEQDFEEHLNYNRGIPCIELNSNYYSNEDIEKTSIPKFKYRKLTEGVDY